MKPPISQVDRDALTSAIAAGLESLPSWDRERLAALADIQGGFPYSWDWHEDELVVVWADITVARIPYSLIVRRNPGRRSDA